MKSKIIFMNMLFISNLISLEIYNNPIEYIPVDANVNLTLSFLEKQDIDSPVKGIQFDLFYNSNEIVQNELTCLIEGITFEYMLVEKNQIRCVLFNLNGKSINKQNLQRLISVSFSQKNNFYSETSVYLDNIIVVGSYGEDISHNYYSNSFKINFDILKPKVSSIFLPANNIFNDSISVSFQIDKASHINMSLYDEYGEKKKTLFNSYMELGIYDFTIDQYDEAQDEIYEGFYKVILSSDNVLKDSIYVVYQKSKK